MESISTIGETYSHRRVVLKSGGEEVYLMFNQGGSEDDIARDPVDLRTQSAFSESLDTKAIVSSPARTSTRLGQMHAQVSQPAARPEAFELCLPLRKPEWRTA